jgi:hypothetical protein
MDEKIKTRVIFKMTPKEVHPTYTIESECVAFLLDCPANTNRVLSYIHVGQHSEADFGWMNYCKLATPEQYADLKKELESMGYDLDIRKRWNR